MWMEELENGKVRYVERYKDPWTGKSKKVSKTFSKHTRQNEKAAYEILQNKIKEKIDSNINEEVRLHELLDLFLKAKAKTCRESTIAAHRSTLSRIYKMPNIIANEIGSKFIKKYLPDTRTFLHRWRLMINWGLDQQLINNTKAKIKVPQQPKRIYDDKRLVNLNDFRALKEQSWTFAQQMFIALFELQLLTGLAFGEAAALTNDDVDKQYLSVTKNYVTTVNKVTPPKRPRRVRDIQITSDIAEVLTRAKSIKASMFFTYKNFKPNNLIFCTSQGNHIHVSQFNKFLKDNLGKTVTSHNARHTYATTLLENGVPVDTVARLLGHDGTLSVQQTYGHVTDLIKKRDFELVKDIKIV